MTAQPKLKAVATRAVYKPVLSAIERRSYAAAHKILSADLALPQLACPGEQRSRKVDLIAKIIAEEWGQRIA